MECVWVSSKVTWNCYWATFKSWSMLFTSIILKSPNNDLRAWHEIMCAMVCSVRSDVMRCDAMLCDAMRCGMMWCYVRGCGPVWRCTMQCDVNETFVTWCDVTGCDVTWRGPAWSGEMFVMSLYTDLRGREMMWRKVTWHVGMWCDEVSVMWRDDIWSK